MSIPQIGSINNPVTGVFGTGNVQVFSSSGTWTVPTGIGKVRARMWGGGAYAGGGGGFAIRTIYDLSGVTSVSVTVGAGGTSTSSTGGTSSFGSYVSATGGTNNSTGGSGSGGDTNTSGGTGNSSHGGGGVGNIFGNGGNGASSAISGRWGCVPTTGHQRRRWWLSWYL